MDQATFIQILIARWRSKTPVFYVKMRKKAMWIGGVFGLISYLTSQNIINTPYNTVISTVSEFLVTFFGAVATTTQFGTEDIDLIKAGQKN